MLAVSLVAVACKSAFDKCEAGDFAQCKAVCEQGPGGRSQGIVACHKASALAKEQRDRSAALNYLDRACDYKASDVCVTLGTLYRDGIDGFPKDKAKAAAIYAKACKDQGYEPACPLLSALAN
jgi:TPR repeat protein